MIHVLKRLQHLITQLSHQSLALLSLISLVVIVFSTTGIYLFERGTNESFTSIWDAIWYSIVTLTTVGYGDKYPITPGGQITAIIVMIAGIGLLAALLGALVTMITNQLAKRRKGMQHTKDINHILLCGWNQEEGENVVREILADKPKEAITLIADLDEHPLLAVPQVTYVKGRASDKQTLMQANAKHAKIALVFADNGLDPESDAKTVLAVMNLKTLNPDMYVVAELVDDEHADYLRRAGCDDVIDPTRIGANIMVQSIQDPGISTVISNLISNRIGNTFYKVPVTPALAGKTFSECLADSRNGICIGYQRSKKIILNPKRSDILKKGDELFLIADKRPLT